MNILVINGPNLNMLGTREPEKYGTMTYKSLTQLIYDKAADLELDIDIYQSNFEGEIVERIQCSDCYDAIILNAGAYTHTSVAIRDALLSVDMPFIEVHITNVYSRERFRHRSLLSDIAVGVICGFKEYSYLLALEYFAYNRVEDE